MRHCDPREGGGRRGALSCPEEIRVVVFKEMAERYCPKRDLRNQGINHGRPLDSLSFFFFFFGFVFVNFKKIKRKKYRLIREGDRT